MRSLLGGQTSWEGQPMVLAGEEQLRMKANGSLLGADKMRMKANGSLLGADKMRMKANGSLLGGR